GSYFILRFITYPALRTGLFMFNPLCGLCELLFIFSIRKKTKLKEDAIKVIKLLYTPAPQNII
ncbi:MAG: hypothetical protein K8R58_09325, partial [Bacteroidales bacterium]|nr:hypothetical protein [Bacteroidales bacterium]